MKKDHIRIKIKFYAILTELTGVKETEIELPQEISPNNLINILKEQFIGFSKIDEYKLSVIILRNGETISSNVRLNHNDLIEILPPSSGG